MPLVGCGLIPARIKADGVTVTAPKDNGKPATVAKSEAGVSVALPEGSKVTVVKETAIPATADKPGVPAKETTIIEPSGPTTYVKTESKTDASTGTVDTSVATHRIDAQERRPLLYASIGAVVAGLAFMYVRFQAVAVMCFVGAGVFFASWKMSEISPWVGGLFIAAAVTGYAFYKRAEWDKDGDGTPDFLQKKAP